MKKMKALQVLILLMFASTQMLAQTIIPNDNIHGLNENIQFNNAQHPCITPEEYQILNKQCAENIKRLGLDKNLQRDQQLTTTLDWPIQAAPGFNDCDYYIIGAYVDQNLATGAVQDFDCGSMTYDGHHGTDISLFPFAFYKMDNDLVEVVAAAPGIIIQKADGNFDRNCGSNTLDANSIIIQHDDGSQALYWHMKKNSLTNKGVGETVVAGEYLGVVGSSGNSSGPHLHFEVWTGSTSTTYNDPFSGNCNYLNTTSWWNVQKPHTDPAVIKVSVNAADIVVPGCPTTETPNESDTYVIPFQGAGLAAGHAQFYVFIRDAVTGLVADCEIINPDGSTYTSWEYTSTVDFGGYIIWYSLPLPTTPGTYTFQSTYNGITCSTDFDITLSAGVSVLSGDHQMQVLQNPAYGTFTIAGINIDNGNYKYTLMNNIGQVIKEENEKIVTNSIDKTFSVSDFSNGIYFLSVESEKTGVVKKLVIQNQ